MEAENKAGELLPFAFAKRHTIVLHRDPDDGLFVSYTGKPELTVLSEVLRFANAPAAFNYLNEENFEHLLASAYDASRASAIEDAERFGDEINLSALIEELPNTADLLEQQDDAPVIRLLNALLSEAIGRGASDIHLETFEKRLLIRFRIDGVLHIVQSLQKMLSPILVSRVKIMAKLDISEKRVPQDGRISLRLGGRPVDVRVSVMPTHFGERIVLRLLDTTAVKLDLSYLGLQQKIRERFTSLLHSPHGIILVTGPTGSGKSTTLYAGLTHLNETTRNVLTVEDPIEYYLPGVGQMQVNTKVGMTFTTGLRAILRQDPDIIMVGEIRDVETAKIAVQASLTGHLVLSTLHTNTAIGAITRLTDMGVEPFLLASSVIGVLAQRLVRLLCPHCKRSKVADAAECERLSMSYDEPPTLYEPVGCELCHHIGYEKRFGIYHLITIDETLQKMIHDQVGEPIMKAYCYTEFGSLFLAGVQCVLKGDTSLEEVLRVTSEA